jgi:transaldolase
MVDAIAQQLEDEGVASFAKSFDELQQALTDKAASF